MSADAMAALSWALQRGEQPEVPRALGLGLMEQPQVPAAWTMVQPRASLTPALPGIARRSLAEEDGGYPLVLVCPERQAESAKARVGRGLLAAQPGGTVWLAAPKRGGVERLIKAMKQELPVALSVDSKHHCRVVSLQVPEDATALREAAARWAALDTLRQGPHGHWTAPGLFAWDRIDQGTQVLLGALPVGALRGQVADVGCGWGAISVDLLARQPKIRVLHLLDDDARALEAAERNIGHHDAVRLHWRDAQTGLGLKGLDAVVMNPPFHDGTGGTRSDLGRSCVHAAADALSAHGVLWLVANRHLAYERTLQARFVHVNEVAVSQGFKVVRAVKPVARLGERSA